MALDEKKRDDLIEFSKKWENYQVLFRAYKDRSFLTQSFMLFFVLRVIFYNIIVSYMVDFPLLQAVLITVMSLMMLIYLLACRPLIRLLNMAELCFYELCIFLVNLCVLIYANLDDQGEEAAEVRDNLADTIIGTNIAFGAFSIIFLVLEVGLALYEGYQLAKKASKEQGTSVCL